MISKTLLLRNPLLRCLGIVFWMSTGLCQVQAEDSNPLADAYSVDGSHVSDYSCKVNYDLGTICVIEYNADVNLTTASYGGSFIVSFNTGNYHSNYLANVGPGYNQTLYAWANHAGFACLVAGNEVQLNITTQAIYNPTNVSATDGVNDTSIVITWDKGTHIPDNLHSYRIYRNDVLIATVPGSARSYTNSGLLPGQSFTYKVKTYTTNFNTHESTGVSDEGSTFSVGLIASNGDHYKKTKLSWNDLSKVATDIRVERSIPGISDKEELAILNKNATTYTDLDGIPGYPYTYSVTPIGDSTSFLTGSDVGYSRPNGKISGHVTSTQGAGVDSVEIFVELLTTIPSGGMALPLNCTATYCALTDISGYYEIEDVYYYTEAEFKIYPKKGTHDFSPDTVVRTLNENTTTQSFVDFTDLNVITVEGRVTYPDGPGQGGPCGVEGVSILINNKDLGILTDADGYWAASLNNNGNYSFSAKLHDHVYEDPEGDTATILYISADKSNIDFENKTLRTIHVVAQGGCQAALGDSVEIQITAPGSCFDTTYFTDQYGLLTINNLPPRDYSVEVIDVYGAGSNTSNILDQLDVPIDIDLTELDTMLIITEEDSLKITPPDTLYPPGDTLYVPADTMLVKYQDTTFTTEMNLRFIYRAPIGVFIDFEDAGADVFACSGDTTVVMDQKEEYLLEINVKEILGDCYIDTGTLVIYDEISDLEGVGQKIPIQDGIARYWVRPGNPDIATSQMNNHQKYLFIVPKIDFADVEPVTFWALVTGIKSNTPSFITRTPEIPQLILHDPPGDNSFATVEKGTTFTTTSSTQIQVGGEGGVYVNFKAGPAADVFAAKIKGGANIQFEAKAGRDNFNNDVTINTITFLESFSTSSGETFVGEQGDVYIGSALNQTFALSQELTFNGNTCMSTLDTVVEMGFQDFATTFIYTEYHIVNSLLPTLETLKGLTDTTTNDGKKEYNRLLADITLWTNILAQNRAARDTNAVFKENISISAGADLTRTAGTTNGLNNSYEYNIFFDASLKVGAFYELESPFAYLAAEGGVMGTFRTARTEVRDTLNETTRSVSFTISDDDIGDFFSIDIRQDTAYDVPAFRIVSGTSSCPREKNTQPREKPAIGVYPPVVNNVPPEEAAQFILDITNLSESGETRQYAIKLVSNSNPDGAIVNVAGSDVNVFPVTYFFDANQTLNLSMTVYKGPLASNYDSIGIMIYSECEYNIWANGGSLNQADTAWFSVNFLSECTNVSMHLPNDGWLVNQASDNELHTAFTGYDINNPFFESITLQMKRDGYGYINQVTIPKEDLVGPFYDYFLDVTNFVDGNYTLRARANCGIDGGYTYSSEVSGIIDRTSLAPFGIPTPSDGFLREGQEVSVTFDKMLDCDFGSYLHEITLIREDTDAAIPFTTSCFGNKVIINTAPPLIEQLDLDGVLVTARVHLLQDENGNVQEYPTEWSFLVNVSPVFWDPDILIASGTEGQSHVIKGVLKNTSLLSKAYSLDVTDAPIIEYPEWLTPIQQHGTILPDNDYTVEFAVDPDLTPGLYTGTVTAMVDSLPVTMEVTFELLARPVYWPFDPSQYQYTMNVVAQFSLDSTDTNLSTDTRDMVAAFVNGQVRGIANIEYLPDVDKYRAFLTVYSNNAGGGGAETVQFRFWHALNGVEYGAMETTTFTLDNTVGSVANPFILHAEGFFQLIPLNKGWTWISLNLKTDDMSREHLFQNILNSPSGNSITVKSKTQTAQYSPGSGWNGNLTTLDLGQGYLVNLSNAPDTLRVVGYPSETTINVGVVNNWNWIGFPRLTPEPVNAVLADLNAAQGDVLKSQYKFSSFDTGADAWLGNLNSFTPGEGYKLRLTNAGTIIFQPSRSDGYVVDPHLYEYNMNVTGNINLSLIGEQAVEDLLIGAFIGGECRGTGTLEYVEAIGAYRVLLLVQGNVGDLGKPIEFRVKNEMTGAEHIGNGQPLSFVADAIIGMVINPYQFFEGTTSTVDQNAEGYALGQSYPNPTDGKTSIGFTIPQSEHVLLSVYDVTGNLVKVVLDDVLKAGQHRVEMDLSKFAEGIYYYELRTEKFSGVKKLVLQ